MTRKSQSPADDPEVAGKPDNAARLPNGGERAKENNDMGRRGEYWETGEGGYADPNEVAEASGSKDFPQPSQQDAGQGSADSTSPGDNGHSMDGSSGNQSQASSDAEAIDAGDGSKQSDSGEHSMSGSEAAPQSQERESSDLSESQSSLG